MKQFSSSPLHFIFLLLSFAIFTFSYGEEIASKFKNYHEVLRLPNRVSGPESLAFDCNGDGPYTGVADGRIFKWTPTQNQWVEFAVNSPNRQDTHIPKNNVLLTEIPIKAICDGSIDPNKEPICGRPLGIKFDPKTCNLYIADAYYGLLMVGPNGGVAKTVAISADDGVPFKFLNGIDIDDQTGIVYFTDSSAVYQRREMLELLLSGDNTGRLLKYDPSSKKVQVLLKGLQLSNGVALSKDGSFLLVAECIPRKIHKFWLKGSKAYTLELFAQLERIPDNIKRNKNGNYWIGLNTNRALLPHASLLQNQALIPIWKKEEENEEDHGDPVAVKFDENGETVEVLDGRGGQELDCVSEVEERDGMLWIGSILKSFKL
ncbi:protein STRICTOSIDINE SYNTHASE-LIKE 10-like [Senna tora]|uniref:Protein STRICTOSIDINE SYNTHASE-LIKE 10-like n=1 Tax=Senna tora TaxID=362788 RepID=A0A834TX32_9FABA|nr:protein STRICTOSIDINE SYNTHASE-LIKE 10-like [Senna tora]